MLQFPGFTDYQVIHSGSRSMVCSATREKDNLRVILKLLSAVNPRTQDVALFYHEYEIAKNLNASGVIKITDLIEHENRYALVEEDFQGISLEEYLTANPLKDFYTIAFQLNSILGELHQANIIHKDINPDNIIIHPETLKIKLIGLKYASQLPHEVQEIVPPEKIEGTLTYMAPEQTGRMNMNIDYRTDFYALGVTYFKMLTGKLPFESKDPLEVIHQLLATPPPLASNVNPEIPKCLALLIQKLMAKDPHDRYQSALGIQADLEKCQKAVVGEEVVLGKNDISDRLNLSQKLYGRQNEINILLDSYEEISQGAVQGLMVSGYSGIGKTMLINEVHKPMTEHKGYFIRGKFDLLQRNMPFTAFRQAFNHLAKIISAEPELQFEAIKQKILQAMGDLGQIIIDLSPDFEAIIGKQRPLPSLPPKEAENRMMIFFKRFVGAIASKEHPLVLFIDDLQWVDSGSLNLLEYILTDEDLTHVLLIGSYRDNEVDLHHPLKLLLDRLGEGKIQYLHLGPLSVHDFEMFFQDSFLLPLEEVRPFAELIFKRTQGNAFFCKQVLLTLYQKKLLYFDLSLRRWAWKMDEIKTLNITDNVVDLMLSKLELLPDETIAILQNGSCIGSQFSLDDLADIFSKPAQEIGRGLWPALQSELIISVNQSYKQVDALEKEKALSKEVTYQFIHDRVQQAVYQTLSEEMREKIHLKIAERIISKDPEGFKNDKLFEVADHFNLALGALDPSQKMDVVNYNYEASQKALLANAYYPMLNYIEHARNLIDENWWEDHHEIVFNVNREYALSLFLVKKFTESEAMTKALMEKAQTNMEKVSLYRIDIMSCTTRGEFEQAINIGALALQLLGVNYSPWSKWWSLYYKMFYVRLLILGKSEENLDRQLPLLKDPAIIAAFEILNEIAYPCFFGDVNLFAQTALTAMELILRYGKSPATGWWFWSYGYIQLKFHKNVDRAFLYWNMAQRVYEELPDPYTSGMAYNCTAYFLNHWRYHEKAKEPYYIRSIRDCIESGNLLAADIARGDMDSYYNWALAKSLQGTLDGMNRAKKMYAESHRPDFYEAHENNSILLENLLKGEIAREDEIKTHMEKLVTYDNHQVIAAAYRMFCYYYFFFESYQEELKYHEKWYQYEELLRFDVLTPEVKTLDALSILKLLPEMKGEEKKHYQKRLDELLKFVEWSAKVAPVNYLHHDLFLKAQREENIMKALEMYDRAIENAKKGDYFLWAALGNELAADMLTKSNHARAAFDYVKGAYYFYERYGMTIKLRLLKKRYPECFLESSSTSETSTSEGLDFKSVIKASQTISGEIVLDKLFEKMLHIVAENAGAEKVLFLENKKKGWEVVAGIEIHNGVESFNMIAKSLDAFDDIPKSVIQFCLRSKMPLLLNHAAVDNQYGQDPYIIKTQTKSLFCLPLKYQDVVKGLIFLENNLTINAFTQERITVLTTLASQIAISLENARHFEVMENLYRSAERFVPKEFLNLLNKKTIEDIHLGDNAEVNLATMFADVRDFTTITEALGTERTVKLLNAYLQRMTPIIRRHNGFVSQFFGDGMMAIFPKNYFDAVEAAIEMQLALPELNNEIKKDGYEPIRIGMGIHAGSAMLITLGEEKRIDSSVISDVVNSSSRIEGLNKFYRTELLFSDIVYQTIQNPEMYQIRLVDRVKVKGKKKPMSIYEPMKEPNSHAYIEKFQKAFKMYEVGNFQEALQAFSRCLEERPQDGVAKVLKERCETLIATGKPSDWDGSYSILEK